MQQGRMTVEAVKLFLMPKYRNFLVIEDDKSSAFPIQLLFRELNVVESISFAAQRTERTLSRQKNWV